MRTPPAYSYLCKVWQKEIIEIKYKRNITFAENGRQNITINYANVSKTKQHSGEKYDYCKLTTLMQEFK